MSPQALTREQKALLQAALMQKEQDLEHELQLLLDGQDRVGHAQELLQQTLEDPHADGGSRELDQARSDATMAALRQVGAALLRLQQREYGNCHDCCEPIAFERLRLNPEALRCIACQTAQEELEGAEGRQPQATHPTHSVI